MRTFRSDNNAGLCAEARQAILEADDGSHQTGYGDDRFTAEAVAAFHTLFGDESSVWFVATGTAGNILAIASLTEPWQKIICHHHSHLNDDESTAPERFTNCRVTAVGTDHTSKLRPADIERGAGSGRGDVHQPQPGVVTISNTTEFGEVYTPDETCALAETAHELGYRLHVDGARFANAVASLDCDPRDLTINAGVDAITFGGTKNGLAAGEAVLFFPQGDGRAFERATHAFPFLRKGSGHLVSKHRFISAPFAKTLADNIWLKHAGHANAMAHMLADGLTRLDFPPAYPVEANAVFVSLPDDVDEALRAAGHQYYPFGEASWRIRRLMCSFDTEPADIQTLLRDAESALVR